MTLPADRWMERGACSTTALHADRFHPELGQRSDQAKRVCRRCPVRVECLDYALATNQREGIWGGMSERERRRLRRAS